MRDNTRPGQPAHKDSKRASGASNNARKPGDAQRGYSKPDEHHPYAKPAYARPTGAPRPDAPRATDRRDTTAPGARPSDTRREFSKPTRAPKPGEHRPHAQPMVTPNPSDGRWAALSALNAVTIDGAYSGLALNQVLRDSRIMNADRRLATELLYGTLENMIHIDYTLNQLFSNTPEPRALNILRIAAYQLMYLTRIPESAACNEAVNQTRRLDMPHISGMVNGVLRNLIRRRSELSYPQREHDIVKYISVEHSMPEFVVERLASEYGAEEAERICAHRVHDNGLTLHPNTLRMSCAEFEAWLEHSSFEWKPGIVPGSYRVYGIGDIAREGLYKQGNISVIGESSLLTARIVHPQAGWRVLDACAAPGGKSACMIEQMQGAGRVYACDIHPHRVELIRSLAERLCLPEIKPSLRDAAEFNPDWEGLMHAVLCDVPCSGLGVISGKPDIKLRLSEAELEELPVLQARILDNCARYVRSGGTLVYSTCTILDAENAGQVRAFLERHPEFELENIAPRVPEQLQSGISDDMLRLLRHRDDVDGFFIACMKRVR